MPLFFLHIGLNKIICPVAKKKLMAYHNNKVDVYGFAGQNHKTAENQREPDA